MTNFLKPRRAVTQEVCEQGWTWIKPSFLWMMYRCGWGLELLALECVPRVFG
ncbi:DUF4291 family protein [Streptomyces sp. AC495_CC817]|uniref:DUF4291 family protein n=1 Tax=Streptomyces sp. AC495_CC817 TaxID=2823900 RepID=UPI0027E0E094|nr:DUF4291 family protein [Streptomyces sp. AC495_CC817]